METDLQGTTVSPARKRKWMLTIAQALQLLEFLVKNGSERVVDDARSHLSLIRMLKQFHYIDQNGKDQGINVRNRSGELVKLLGDVDAIRQERKKSRSNKNKYSGVEGGAGLGSGLSTGPRYGGFGSEQAGYGGYQGEVYGDGGGFGGRETDYSGTQRHGDQFEEYDAEENGSSRTPAARSSAATSSTRRTTAPAKKKEPEPDLFEFGDEEATAPTNGKAPAISNVLDDFGAGEEDDFDEFQSASSPTVAQPIATPMAAALSPPPMTSTTTSSTQFAAPQPVAPPQQANLNSLFATTSQPSSATPSMKSPPPSSLGSPPPPLQAQPYKPSGPNYYTSVPAAMNTGSSATSAFSARPSVASTNQTSYSSSTSAATLGKPTAKASAGSGDVFGNLWSSASSKAGVPNKPTSKGPDLASMAKAKSEAGIWGAPAAVSGLSQPRPGATAPTPNTAAQGKPLAQQQSLGNGLDDLLG